VRELFASSTSAGAAGSIDDTDIIARMADSAQEYRSATPFPHAVFDGVLASSIFDSAVGEFPAPDDPTWNAYVHVNEHKFAHRSVDQWGSTLQAVFGLLTSDSFVVGLRAMTGIAGLFPDESLDGGGLHQTLRGGHLNVHRDFTAHHTHRTWRRQVNVLLYLNARWEEEWGGSLELWDRTMQHAVQRVSPIGNRMLVFTTSGVAHHGHPDPLTCPPDVARRSLALYYFTEEIKPARRATDYRARPGDGLRSLAIRADRAALAAYDRVRSRFAVTETMMQRLQGWASRRVR
jgi:hypothetical protein